MAENQNNQSDRKAMLFGGLAGCLILLLTALIYLCNRETIFIQDDLWYWTNLATGERISGISDIVESQIWHYLHWGGRTVAHTTLQFLLWGGGEFCNILNTLVFLALAVFLALTGNKVKKKNILWEILLTGSMLVTFNPCIYDTLFWQSATANYLYMTMLSFPLVWLYLRQIRKTESVTEPEAEDGTSAKKNGNVIVLILQAAGIFCWGLLAGWTNENMGATYFLLSVVTIAVMRIRKSRVPLWMITGSAAMFTGSAILILAPGNRERGDTIVSLGSWKLDLCKRVIDYFKGPFEYLLPVYLTAVLVFVLYRILYKKMPELSVCIVLLAGVVAHLALVLSPHVPERSLFGVMCFLIWGIVQMLREILEHGNQDKYRYLITILITLPALHKLFFFWTTAVGWYRYV